MDLQINISDLTRELLQKEASEKNSSVSKIVSTLLENYFAMRQKMESPTELLSRFAAESPRLTISEEESMEEINAEIKAYRIEQKLKHNNQPL